MVGQWLRNMFVATDNGTQANKRVPQPSFGSTALIGATGTKLVTDEVWNYEDYNTDLTGEQWAKWADRMRKSDPIVGACLMRIKSPLMSAKVSVMPGKSQVSKSGKRESTDKDKEIAAKLEEWFISEPYSREVHRPINEWRDLLRHILHAWEFGFSVFEYGWGVTETGLQAPVIIEPRLQRTVYRFTLDPVSRGLASISQRANNPATGSFEDFELPATQCAVFSWGQEGHNWFGVPMLRAAWKAWKLKELLEKIDAMGQEKHGMGVDEIHALEPLQGPELEEAKKVAYEVRANERGGIFTSEKVKYELHSPGAGQTSVHTSIDMQNEAIAMALLNELMRQGGSTTSGNRALGQIQQADIRMGIQAAADWVEAGCNHYWLWPTAVANWGPQQSMPYLEFDRFDKLTGADLADTVQKYGKHLTPGAKTEQHIREVLSFPEEDEPYQDPTAPPVNPLAPPQPPELKGKATTPTDRSAAQPQRFSSAYASPVLPTDRPFRRDLLPHEQHVSFKDIRAMLDNEPVRIWHTAVAPIRAKQIDQIAQAAASATDTQVALGQLPHPLVRQMGDALTAALNRVYAIGRSHVVQELDRQKSGVSANSIQLANKHKYQFASPEDAYDTDQQTPDETTAAPDPGDATDEATDEPNTNPTRGQKGWIKSLALGLAASQVAAMILRAKEAAITARNVDGVAKATVVDKVRQALRDLSTNVGMADLAGLIARVYSNGRDEQAQAMKDQIATEYYSAVMDEGTCEVCASYDGMEQDPGDTKFETPNPECDWPERCRCITVYESVGQQEAA